MLLVRDLKEDDVMISGVVRCEKIETSRGALARRFTVLLVGAAAILLAGCVSMGPGTIARDRLDYDNAVSESWKRQLLLNLVKLRYGDAPLFLDVASIINSYGLETQVSLAANWANIVGSGAKDAQSLGGAGRYTDKPTITYNPLLGKRFTTSLMTPVPPGVVVSLIQAGWAADAVLRLMVTSVNGVQNRFGAGARGRGADPEFYRLIAALRRIQASGEFGMRVERQKDQEWAVMTLSHKKVTKEVEEDQRAVHEILGLRPGLGEFRVVFGSAPRTDDEIAMITRSMLEMLFDLAGSIEVPPSHVEEGRAPETRVFETDEAGNFRPMVLIHSGKEQPMDAFVAVSYRDHWFWVEDRDFPSKGIFSYLLILFSLTETDSGKGAPIVTIPAS
jgi:hypothetical protein